MKANNPNIRHIKAAQGDEYIKNEYNTNKVVSLFLLVFLALGITNSFSVRIDATQNLVQINDFLFAPLNLILLCMLSVAWYFKFSARWIKYMLLCGAMLVCSIAFFVYTTYALYLIFVPIFISIRYFDKKLILTVSISTAILFILVCVLSVALEPVSDKIAGLHQSSTYNPWQYFADCLIYIMIPCILLMLFLGFFAFNITESSRKLLSDKTASAKKIAAVDAEIGMAAQIQKSVLPAPEFTVPNGNLILSAYEIPAKDVCGDFYDYYMLKNNVLAVVVADVSDKGMPAAMFMMSAKKALQCAISSRHTLSDSIELANSLICTDNEYGMFLTLWMAVIDTETGVGKYINAGHPYPIIKHADGTTESIENEPDLFIGNFPEKAPAVHTFRLKRDDTLIVYTDGLTDSANKNGEHFGLERLTAAIKSGNKNAGAEILSSANRFCDGNAQFDDITLLTLKCLKTNEPRKFSKAVPIGINGTGELNDAVQSLLNGIGCPDETRRSIGVAVDEICANISDYAYSNGGNIFFNAELGANYIKMEFADAGVPFNPLEKAAPSFDDPLQIGGFGIYFVRQLSDSYSYEYSENMNRQKLLFVWNM